MTCKCAYMKPSNDIGRGVGYYCRNPTRKGDKNEDLCCVTSIYWTGHARWDVNNNLDNVSLCNYRKYKLSKKEKIRFDMEDKKERRELRKLEKSLAKMTPEDWAKLKIEAYADY